MLALALRRAGFAVREAGSELELQRILKHTQPDALVINWQRSKTASLNLVARMRARASLHGVPIVFLAGTDTDDFQQQATRAGATWFSLRPLGMARLQTRMHELVEHRATTRKRVS